MLVNLKETGEPYLDICTSWYKEVGGGVVRRLLVEKTDWGWEQRSGQHSKDRPWTRGRKEVEGAGNVLILSFKLRKEWRKQVTASMCLMAKKKKKSIWVSLPALALGS